MDNLKKLAANIRLFSEEGNSSVELSMSGWSMRSIGIAAVGIYLVLCVIYYYRDAITETVEEWKHAILYKLNVRNGTVYRSVGVESGDIIDVIQPN